jgi:Rrf2 family protein
MLRFSKPEEHALRLVMALAREGGQRTLAELAGGERLPVPTVAKLLGRLRDGGVILALRGRNGGYELRVSPGELSVAEVLGAVGMPLLPRHECLAPGHLGCPRLDDCGLRAIWEHLEAQVSSVLRRVTVADLMQAEEQVHARVAALWPAPAVAAELSSSAAEFSSPQGADDL